MEWPEVVIWKLAGGNWRRLKSSEQSWSLSTAMLCEWRSLIMSLKNKVTWATKRKRKNLFTSTPHQTTAYVTTPWDLRECWEEYVVAMTSPQPNARCYATPVDWNITQSSKFNWLSVGAGLCGAVAWNVIRARKSILRQLAPRDSRGKISSPCSYYLNSHAIWNVL